MTDIYPRAWLRRYAKHSGEECLFWPFAMRVKARTGKPSYGTLWAGKGKQLLPHREMCRLAHGPPPAEKSVVRHLCGMGMQGCVNPRHLVWGSTAENAADAKRHRSERNIKIVRTSKNCRLCDAVVENKTRNFCARCRPKIGLGIVFISEALQ